MSRKCPYCNNGWIDADPPSSYGYRCPDCGGTGYIDEEGIDYWTCPECGERMDEDAPMCWRCQERMEAEEELEDEVPAEVQAS